MLHNSWISSVILLCHTTKIDAPRHETIEMRITIPQIVTCRAHILDDNPQKAVNPDQTQPNPGFRLGHLEKNWKLQAGKYKSVLYWDVEQSLGFVVL